MKTFKNFIKEDGMGAGAVSAGPTNVTGAASGTDPVSATAVDMKKKKRPFVLPLGRRKPPKI